VKKMPSTVEDAKEAVLITDSKGVIQAGSCTAHQMFVYEFGELADKPIDIHCPFPIARACKLRSLRISVLDPAVIESVDPTSQRLPDASPARGSN
jgi:hypothetical protein